MEIKNARLGDSIVITPSRIDEVIKLSNQWPHWGNVKKFMTKKEINYTNTIWKTMNGNASFISALWRIKSKSL